MPSQSPHHRWMELHVHVNRLARNAITTVSFLECRYFPYSKSSTINFTDVQTNSNVRPLRQYDRMTHRYRQLIIHLRRVLPSHTRLQERSVSSPCRATNFIIKRVTFDGHICDTPPVVDPAPDTLHHRPRFGSSTRRPLGLHYSTRDRLNDSSIARRYHTVNQTLDPQQTPGIESTVRGSRHVASQCDALIVNGFAATPFCTHHKPSTNELISTLFKELFSYFVYLILV